jgi:hypothetical protein
MCAEQRLQTFYGLGRGHFGRTMNGVTLSKILAEICQSVGPRMITQYKAECNQHIADEEYHE